MVSLPDTLLEQMDYEIQGANIDRSEFICESLEYYMAERRRRRAIRQQLAEGYQAMAALNLELVRESESNYSLGEYERALSEGD